MGIPAATLVAAGIRVCMKVRGDSVNQNAPKRNSASGHFD